MLRFSTNFKETHSHEYKQLRMTVVVFRFVLTVFSLQMWVGSVFHRHRAI